MKKRPSFSPARFGMKLLCTLLGIVLAAMLGITAVAHSLLGNVRRETTELIFSQAHIQSTVSEVRQDAAQLFSLGIKNTGSREGIVNILLIGQDRRENEAHSRSDSMILCTFHKDEKRLTLTSILRDLYVPIPGYSDNRINAAYAFGGMSLLEETIEQNFGVTIDGSVEVDFSQFSEIIDTLGGVEIELRQDEADLINDSTGSSLNQGLQRLNGQQALAYTRIRSLDTDGDFSRTNRQRKIMSALVDAYKDAGPAKLLNLMATVLSMVTTDMKNGEILKLALDWVPLIPEAEIISQRIPADGTYTDETINGMSVLVADMESIRKLLEETVSEK